MDAGWDEELLRLEIEALQAEMFDLSLTGFDEKELSDLFKDDADVHKDDFDVETELKAPVITRAGDVWTLGSGSLGRVSGKAVFGAGPLPLSVAARADPVWLEKGRQAP